MTGAVQKAVIPPPSTKKSLWQKLWDQKYLMLMSIPMLLYVMLFNYYPLWGWRYAFQNLDISTIKKGADWIGLGNFEWLFKEKLFWLGFRNTLAMSVINLVFGTTASVAAVIWKKLNCLMALPGFPTPRWKNAMH